MDWSRVYDQVNHRTAALENPFTDEFEDWSPPAGQTESGSPLLGALEGLRSRLRRPEQTSSISER